MRKLAVYVQWYTLKLPFVGHALLPLTLLLLSISQIRAVSNKKALLKEGF
jgi:hypothetical protein